MTSRRLPRREKVPQFTFAANAPSANRHGMTTITDRIERELGIPGLATLLAERLEPSDMQSLLLEVYRRLVRRRSTPSLLVDYSRNRFVEPSPISPGEYVEWDRHALSLLPRGVEAIELSPVCPLGVSAAMAGLEQDRVISTIRNTEVLSDSTNVLALEAAVRRRALKRGAARSGEPVHLAASHRLVRGQRYADPRFAQHFKVFSLCSAGRDGGGFRFEVDALEMHISFYVTAIRDFLGPSVTLDVSLTLLDAGATLTATAEALLGKLRERLGVEALIDPARTVGRGYYRTACFWIHGSAGEGEKSQLCDGGCVDWTQRLLSDAKERIVISGVGTDRVCTMRRKRNT